MVARWQEIAFIKWGHAPGRDIETDIYVINADGTNERRLTFNPGDEGDPAWSPDGERIAFSSDRDAASEWGNFDLYVMNADGTNVQRLTDTPAPRFEYWPDFSPDGDVISFTRTVVSDDESDLFDLWVMNVDGSEPHVLLKTPQSEFEAAWSPDGQRIVFACGVESAGSDELCVMNADGTGRREVLTRYGAGLGGVSSPDWAPARSPE